MEKGWKIWPLRQCPTDMGLFLHMFTSFLSLSLTLSVSNVYQSQKLIPVKVASCVSGEEHKTQRDHGAEGDY